MTPKLILAGIILTVLSLAAWRIHHSIYQSGFEAGKQEQIKLSQVQCDKEKALTSEVSSAYQKKLADLNRQLHARRMQSYKCVAVSRSSAPGRDAAASGEELRGQARLPAGPLYELAGDAERTRLQLISCQELINRAQSPP